MVSSCFAPTSPFIFLSWGLTRNMAVLCYFQRHSSSHPATKHQSSSSDRERGWCKKEKHVCCAGLIRPSGCRDSTCDGDKKKTTKIHPWGHIHNACVCRTGIFGAVLLCVVPRHVWARHHILDHHLIYALFMRAIQKNT